MTKLTFSQFLRETKNEDEDDDYQLMHDDPSFDDWKPQLRGKIKDPSYDRVKAAMKKVLSEIRLGGKSIKFTFTGSNTGNFTYNLKVEGTEALDDLRALLKKGFRQAGIQSRVTVATKPKTLDVQVLDMSHSLATGETKK